MEKPKIMKRKDIKISEALYGQVSAEVGRFGITHKAYAEAALKYFVTRRINPSAMPKGMIYELLQFIDQGFDRLIRIIIRQEKEKTDLLLLYGKSILQEQINARILIELDLKAGAQRANYSIEQQQVIRKMNDDYAQKRKAELTEIYNRQLFAQPEK